MRYKEVETFLLLFIEYGGSILAPDNIETVGRDADATLTEQQFIGS
ncbi:MAG TPA: hypothetical protein PLW02_08350 [Verrucomicrobiota bacterium]|nr:hypothetical protein [Verrucomicrobiota bacterium]